MGNKEPEFLGFPKQRNIFQPPHCAFFLMPSYAAQLSTQRSENKIRGQMPTPSRNVMGEEKNEDKFSLTGF